jgi:propanol-preferring alcohol dehydrogenase
MGSLSSPRSNCAILPSGASYGSPYTFIHRVPPLPGHGEALVRLHFTGVCHGDVYTRDGGGPVPKVPIRPLVGGHEGIGEIVSLGAACDAYEFAVGDSVGVAWRRQVCRECEACLVGAENDCPQQKIVGLHGDGTFQRQLRFRGGRYLITPIFSN